MKPRIERIVVIKPCCIGDCVMALPSVDALHAACPEAELDVYVGRHSAPVFEHRPGVSRICEIPDIPRSRDVSALASMLRRGGYSLVLLLDRSRWLRLAVRLSGARRVVRVRDPEEGWQHEGDLYLAALATADIEAVSPQPELKLSAAERAVAATALQRCLEDCGSPAITDEHEVRPYSAPSIRSSGNRSYVVLHPGGAMNPGALMLQKRWPADRHIELARVLRERGLNILVTGGPDEVELAARIVTEAGLPETCNVAGQLSLMQVAALAERAALYVGADTGVSHLAAASGAPVVVIFGPTNPIRYGPRGPRVTIVAPAESYQIEDVDLRHGPGIGRAVATTRVSVEEVLAACDAMLQLPASR